MSIKLPIIKLTLPPEKPPKRKVYIYIFYSQDCPHCRKYILNPESSLNQAIKEIKENPEYEVHEKRIDVYSREGRLEAEEAGIKYVPTVIVNGEIIPNKLLNDKEALLDIFKGNAPPSPFEEKMEERTPLISFKRIKFW